MYPDWVELGRLRSSSGVVILDFWVSPSQHASPKREREVRCVFQILARRRLVFYGVEGGGDYSWWYPGPTFHSVLRDHS